MNCLYSGLILDTYCLKYPQVMSFLNTFWYFNTPKALKLHVRYGLRREFIFELPQIYWTFLFTKHACPDFPKYTLFLRSIGGLILKFRQLAEYYLTKTFIKISRKCAP